jgi:uncharacterized iron-regulated membrane protein
MSLDVFIGIAGGVITVLVVAGMVLIAPRGAVPRRANEEPPRRDTAPAAEPVERAVR